MVLKEIDKDKENAINILKSKINESSSKPQQILIKKELKKLETGLEGEKQAAYFIDFNLKDSENYVILHDLRFEIDNLTAQIDHILINRALGIMLIETKNTDAEVTINNDGSMTYKYKNGKSYNQANPLEQSKRHEKVLEKILQKYNMDMKLYSYVVFLPEVKITNENLPKGFHRADSFVSEMIGEHTKNPLTILKLTAKVIMNSALSNKQIENIGNILINEHKPINIDYDKKYKISTKVQEEVDEVEEIQEEIKLTSEEMNRKKFKDITKSKKYMGNEMISITCIKCETKQNKSKARFENEVLHCKKCGY